MTDRWRFVFACIAAEAVVVLLALLIGNSPAPAQEHHERHHNVYRDWKNQNDSGCCNNQDCGELANANERTTPTGIEVHIDGEWCPVKPHHYLKQGNAPNWAMSHACVRPAYSDEYGTEPEPACARLLCYQPKPGS